MVYLQKHETGTALAIASANHEGLIGCTISREFCLSVSVIARMRLGIHCSRNKVQLTSPKHDLLN